MSENLEKVAREISSGVKLTKVNLCNAGLTEFPDFLCSLCDCLEELNLGGNHLRELPSCLVKFTKLRVLFLGQNEFVTYPEILGQISSLTMISFKSNKLTVIPPSALSASVTWLILTDNKIEELPASIGRLTGLRKLMLSGNKLTSLPHELSNCTELELLRIAANELNVLPDWLLAMPKLSWLAYAGNPLVEDTEFTEDEVAVTDVDWSTLDITEKIGEGASGNVYKAVWRLQGGNNAVDVAVKMFKGETTSDGLPLHEMQATESVGEHANFANVLGRVVNAPNNQLGLVLPLVDCSPDAYQILGNPPSFTTCTRDTFPPETSFSYDTIVGVLQAMASACAHLHKAPVGPRQRGIMHGDLYPHNILLHRGTGHALLTDFGAASFKPHFPRHAEPVTPGRLQGAVRSEEAEQCLRLEQIEVRAFGCLVDDLLSLADPNTAATVERVASCSRTASRSIDGDAERSSSVSLPPPADLILLQPPVEPVPSHSAPAVTFQDPAAAMELLHLGVCGDVTVLLEALRAVCCNPVVKERPTFDVICGFLCRYTTVALNM